MTLPRPPESAEVLRREADSCRRLAGSASTAEAARILRRLAGEYDGRAAALERAG